MFSRDLSRKPATSKPPVRHYPNAVTDKYAAIQNETRANRQTWTPPYQGGVLVSWF